ncbi:DUF1810 domain-containing protein [bacterium]|nr:MAG: DUF1810 domain-containing protein [bacterium]
MPPTNDPTSSEDAYNLNRFLQAQQVNYEQALLEMRAGCKRTHWMWYIFPQLEGLSLSARSRHYAIRNLEEARSYLSHPILGARLLECAQALMQVEGKSVSQILGSPDDEKLWASATLFALVSPAGSVFEGLLEKYYQRAPDKLTLELLGLIAEEEKTPTE